MAIVLITLGATLFLASQLMTQVLYAQQLGMSGPSFYNVLLPVLILGSGVLAGWGVVHAVYFLRQARVRLTTRHHLLLEEDVMSYKIYGFMAEVLAIVLFFLAVWLDRWIFGVFSNILQHVNHGGVALDGVLVTDSTKLLLHVITFDYYNEMLIWPLLIAGAVATTLGVFYAFYFTDTATIEKKADSQVSEQVLKEGK